MKVSDLNGKNLAPVTPFSNPNNIENIPPDWETVYRWDINIRESTVLGFVGAGGLGILLYSSINQFLWQEVALILLSVFGVVIVSEFVSAAVCKRIS